MGQSGVVVYVDVWFNYLYQSSDFLPDLVDLSVCLCVTNIASKVHGFDEIFRVPSTSQHHSAFFCTYTPDLFHCSIVSKNCSYPLDDLSVSCICTAVTGVSVLVLDSLNPPPLLKCLSGKDTPKMLQAA